jgi:hypothetical protein
MNFGLDEAREVLRSTPATLRALLIDLSDAWLHGSEAADAWSPYQVVGHMLHIDETDWIDRTRVILEHGTSRQFDPVDREAGFAKFAGWTLADLLDRFDAARHDNLAQLDSLLGPGDLERRGVHPTFGEVTLEQLLATWTVHDLNHLNQIVKTMAKLYTDAVGPWREFLPVLDAP